MFDNPRIFRRSYPDFPTTPAVQDRLVAAGRVEGEGPLARGQAGGLRCRACGISLHSDPDADQAIPACGTCKARPEAHATTTQGARAFTDADRSLIRKLQNVFVVRRQIAGCAERQSISPA